MRITTRRALAALAAAALACAAQAVQAEKRYDPGASDTEIRIGNANPYSGPASAYGVIGRTLTAYFKMVNERGGINGRKVTFITYDDQYTPARTIEVTRKLVEQDNVLALSGNVGTAANLAIQRYVNSKKIPSLMIAVGSEKFNDPKNNTWAMPFNPSYEGEGAFYAKSVLKSAPDAKIAVLYQNDDFGKDVLRGLEKGLGDKAKTMIVGKASYELSDASVDSQVVQLRASGADVVMIFGLARHTAQAIRKVYDLGWRPRQQYITYVSAYVKTTFEPAGVEKSLGVMSMRFAKDPAQSRWDNDAETIAYKQFLKRYMPEEDIANTIAVYGYINGQALEYVLKKAGDNLTRENLLRQATSFKDVHLAMLSPGITLTNSPSNYFPFSNMQMVRFNGKELEPVGEPMNIR